MKLLSELEQRAERDEKRFRNAKKRAVMGGCQHELVDTFGTLMAPPYLTKIYDIDYYKTRITANLAKCIEDLRQYGHGSCCDGWRRGLGGVVRLSVAVLLHGFLRVLLALEKEKREHTVESINQATLWGPYLKII